MAKLWRLRGTHQRSSPPKSLASGRFSPRRLVERGPIGPGMRSFKQAKMTPPSLDQNMLISWVYWGMPLASIRPYNLRAFHVGLAAQNIKLCSFGRRYVIRLSGRTRQCDDNRHTQDRTDTGSYKFVREHGSFPTGKELPLKPTAYLIITLCLQKCLRVTLTRDPPWRYRAHPLSSKHQADRGGFPSPDTQPPRLDKPKLRQQLRSPECV